MVALSEGFSIFWLNMETPYPSLDHKDESVSALGEEISGAWAIVDLSS
jgi:hypothetical protein